jgi:polyisoprenoid-binding protein YceI
MGKQSFQVDAAHSAISFSVRHMVISKVKGKFAKWTAKLDLDAADLAAASVEVEIDAASIDTGVPDRDAHLRSADFFDTAKYPTLTYKSRGVKVLGPESLRVIGDLTLHGVTKEVDLEVELGGQGKDPWGNVRTGFTARASLNRKEFGLAWNQALETGGVLVSDKVEIEIELQAIQQAAKAA